MTTLEADTHSSLNPTAAFTALTGREPYRWQLRLLREWLAKGDTPEAVDVPTGLGKTMTMALWLVARAMGAALPRRLVYVVDRRAVVDQATEEAEKLAGALARRDDPAIVALRAALGLDVDQELPVSTLRGQHADNRAWLKAPHLPAIIVGTIDMIGSRLLFEGYGVSRRMRPMHAGLIGADAWVVLDEAHLVPPFEALLRAIVRQGSVAPVPSFRTTSLSATGRSTTERLFALSADDISGDERASARLSASKRLRLRKTPKGDLAEAMAECAIELANEGGRRVVVFANSRKTAQKVATLIEKDAPSAPKPELLVGARRVRERERLKDSDVFRRYSSTGCANPGATFLVATSAGEVGVDLDADALVCDFAPWERMVQRLGRVNRRAAPGVAPVVAFDAVDVDDEDAPQDSAESRKLHGAVADATALALRELLESVDWRAEEDGAREASPLALRRLKEAAATNPALRERLAQATTPEPLRPALTPALLDAWSMTSLEVHTGRPIVEPWLRGWVDKQPQTRVVWRKVLPPIAPDDPRATTARLNAFFEAAPPHLTETLETYSREVADLIAKRVAAVCGRGAAESELAASALPEMRGDDLAAIVLGPAGDVERHMTVDFLVRHPLDPRDVREIAGRTIVLDARLGGLDDAGLLDASAKSAPPVLDGEASDWRPNAATIGFHVRIVARDEERDSGWRVAFRCAAAGDDQDDEIRVEVHRDRSDAAGDLAIARRAQTLAEHSATIAAQARKIAAKLELPRDLAETLATAARLHDLGKKRTTWQRAMNAPTNGAVYAKTEGGGNPQLLRIGEETYRHEFGSLREAEADGALDALTPEARDLALHLIAAHHGFGRPVIAAVDPDEPPTRSVARAPEIALRYARLQKRWGWWGLAWWESLLRAADWAASAQNDAAEGDHG
jgi:CRISPR-associated endonuclease/helicase Cas3